MVYGVDDCENLVISSWFLVQVHLFLVLVNWFLVYCSEKNNCSPTLVQSCFLEFTY